MAEAYTFTKGSAERIGDAVRRVEGMALVALNKRHKFNPGSGVEIYHFKTQKVTTDSIKVRAGAWVRYVGALRYHILMGIDPGSPATSGDMQDILTIDVSGLSDGLAYAVLTLTDAVGGNNVTQPDTLTVSATNTAPTGNEHNVELLAHWTMTSGKITTSIVQDWNGGNIFDFTMVEDGLSTNYDSDGEFQINGWETAVANLDDGTGFAYNADPMIFQDAGNTTLHYITLLVALQNVDDWSGVDLTRATGPWEDPGNAYKSHHALDVYDPVNETPGTGYNDYDDHGILADRITTGEGVGNDAFPLMLLGLHVNLATMYARNSIGAEDNVLGNSLDVEDDITAGNDITSINDMFCGNDLDVTRNAQIDGTLDVDGVGTFDDYVSIDAGAVILGDDGVNAILGYFNDGAGNIVTVCGNDTYPMIIAGGRYDTDTGYAVGGANGLSIAGHTGGILTSEADFIAGIETLMNNLLAGYGLI